MPVHVWVAATAVAASIPLLWWALSSTRTTAGGLANAGSSSPDLRSLVLDQAASDRVVRPMLARLAERVRRFTPVGSLERIERRIDMAGLQRRWPVERVLAAKFLLGVAVGLIGWSLIGPVLAVALGVLSFFVPDVLLDGRARERQALIRLELPDVLDQMTMTVEAGLGFEAAMARAAEAGDGPLASELTRTVQEMQLGATRTDAMRSLAARSDVRDLQTFVSAVVQSEEYGLPIAHTLRVQSEELRVKRRQRAEEEAMKIPVKIIFPLVACIFPTMFIVLLGPAIIQIFTNVIQST